MMSHLEMVSLRADFEWKRHKLYLCCCTTCTSSPHVYRRFLHLRELVLRPDLVPYSLCCVCPTELSAAVHFESSLHQRQLAQARHFVRSYYHRPTVALSTLFSDTFDEATFMYSELQGLRGTRINMSISNFDSFTQFCQHRDAFKAALSGSHLRHAIMFFHHSVDTHRLTPTSTNAVYSRLRDFQPLPVPTVSSVVHHDKL